MASFDFLGRPPINHSHQSYILLQSPDAFYSSSSALLFVLVHLEPSELLHIHYRGQQTGYTTILFNCNVSILQSCCAVQDCLYCTTLPVLINSTTVKTTVLELGLIQYLQLVLLSVVSSLL